MRAPIITDTMRGRGLEEWETREISVKDPPFRAKGDGVTDETAAIQRAVNSIPLSSDLRTIFFPAGDYLISDTIRTGSKRVRFIGQSGCTDKETCITMSDANKTFIDTTGAHAFFCMDIAFVGQGKAAGTGNGIVLGSASQVCFSGKVINCSFQGVPNYAIYADYVRNCNVLGCTFEKSVAAIFSNHVLDHSQIRGNKIGDCNTGITWDIGSQNVIANNQISSCGVDDAGDLTKGGIVINFTDQGTVAGYTYTKGNIVGGNNFTGNRNDILLLGTYAISGWKGAVQTHISNNVSDKARWRFLYADSPTHTTVLGNTIIDAGLELSIDDPNLAAAIELAGTTNETSIIDNTIKIHRSGSLVQVYGLVTGPSTTNTYLKGNVFEGADSDTILAGTFRTPQYMSGLDVARGDLQVYDETSLGSELVSNGDFSTIPDTNWIWGSNWTHDIVNEEADHATGSTATLSQNITIVANQIYLVQFTIKNSTYNGSQVRPTIGGKNGTYALRNGIVRQIIRATNTNGLVFTPYSNFNGSIDDVSVKQIIGGDIKLAGLLTGGGTSGIKVTAAGNVGFGTSDPKSIVDIVGLPIYANNAAAIAGGLLAGSLYRTGADPDPVCVVH